MRIGVVPNLDRELGGTFQYSVTMLRALRDVRLDDQITVYLYSGETLPPALEDLGFPVVEMRPDRGPAGSAWGALSRWLTPEAKVRARQLLGAGLSRIVRRVPDGHSDDRPVDAGWVRFFQESGAELLLFTSDSDVAFASGLPYVAAIHDLQYLLQPEFPELSDGDEYERRDFTMRNSIAWATVMLVDSEVGKEDVLALFGEECDLDPGSIVVLPFLPADYLLEPGTDVDKDAVTARYGLTSGYLFYPAQFWPHKNHRRIVEALGVLRRDGHEIPLALAGSKPGPLGERTFQEMMDVARELGVDDLVRYLGYVPDGDMPALYSRALALVMPTFFGPTNIPVVEAWSLGCPVITSDIRGVRDQVGDGALLVDPRSSASIADGIRRLLREPGLAGQLAECGHARLAEYTRAEYSARLAAAISEAKRRVRAVQADDDAGPVS